MIRKATDQDIPYLSSIHMAALPDDLLPRLGTAFLTRCFYPAGIDSKNAFILVNVNAENCICAFSVFAYDSELFLQAVKRRKFFLFFSMFKTVLASLSFLKEIAIYLRKFRMVLKETDIDLSRFPELYLIATNPEYQGLGLGGELLTEGLARLRTEGCLVKTSSTDAKRFYIRHGFREIGKEYRGSRCLSVLLIEFFAV